MKENTKYTVGYFMEEDKGVPGAAGFVIGGLIALAFLRDGDLTWYLLAINLVLLPAAILIGTMLVARLSKMPINILETGDAFENMSFKVFGITSIIMAPLLLVFVPVVLWTIAFGCIRATYHHRMWPDETPKYRIRSETSGQYWDTLKYPAYAGSLQIKALDEKYPELKYKLTLES